MSTPNPGKYSVRPIVRFAEAAAQCSKEGSVYGACIFKDYQHVTKDKCATEFMALKQCYLKHAKRR